jgi:hypothetical protein
MTRRGDPTHLSTSVVARLLGVKPDGVRAMIAAGTLPEPQWLNLGRRDERIYSLEWLALATEHLNERRLDGLEIDHWIRPVDGLQIAVRIDRPEWSTRDAGLTILALSSLWDACIRAVESDASDDLPSLTVRRLSAGSPLDLLAWVHVGAGVAGAGGAASLFMYVLKHPERVSSAIPRLVAGWRQGWAEASDAKLRLLQSRQNLERFAKEAQEALTELGSDPRWITIDGEGTGNLELLGAESEQPHASGSEANGDH